MDGSTSVSEYGGRVVPPWPTVPTVGVGATGSPVTYSYEVPTGHAQPAGTVAADYATLYRALRRPPAD
jgi:hypothetical protein